ncbi:MAG: gliding motility-associated C-terminal domain-containing protein [Bacteroidetes bacterium]|nr:gliding motility-associated C-terminal domain-containing protein [Bacteroidota bacterium]
MMYKSYRCIVFLLFITAQAFTQKAFAQAQACPPNFNFGFTNLTNWGAYTGNNKSGNGPSAILRTYNTTSPLPLGTLGATTIPEYANNNTGINVITANGLDPFGFFPTIPTINGYQYNYSVKLGSTSITQGGGGGAGGGYIRGITYTIDVPTSAVVQPYTITYAYAMVLENGSHITSQQPLITVTLKTSAGIISCASPQYNLPTLDDVNTGGGGATLDTAAARRQGFTLSGVPTPNNNGNPNESGYRVYYKDWREVTLDLAPYRGQTVTLTFEADNCVPGGHFSYVYIALRNICAGLQISGNSTICANSTQTYSIPALAGATYNWTIPSGWTVVSGQDSNIVVVKPNNQSGSIIAHEQNSCADLYDTLQVTVNTPGSPGTVNGGSTVCAASNSTLLTLTGNSGNVVSWLSSTNNGASWQTIANTSNTYAAGNLNTTTMFKALVVTSPTCPADSSTAATIIVDPKSAGGALSPATSDICLSQTSNTILNVIGSTGNVLNWQSSLDGGISWNGFNPVKTDLSYAINGSNVNASVQYRVIVKSGVCPADTGAAAKITYYNVPFPRATIDPADTSICYSTAAKLNALITTGTSYSWIHSQPLTGSSSGTISTLPAALTVTATPNVSSLYILSISNAGCPNTLKDTFRVKVLPEIAVNAGNDTSVVIGQPLVLQGSADNSITSYLWSPPTGLNNTTILQPTAVLTEEILNGYYYITYTLTVTNAIGCSASDDVVVRVFKTGPSVFVPNAFTPNNDGVNDVLRPILAGIKQLDFFRIYNRFGQLMYQTQRAGEGWDGTFKGTPQDTNTFVYTLQAVDYKGTVFQQKGTFILIR